MTLLTAAPEPLIAPPIVFSWLSPHNNKGAFAPIYGFKALCHFVSEAHPGSVVTDLWAVAQDYGAKRNVPYELKHGRTCISAPALLHGIHRHMNVDESLLLNQCEYACVIPGKIRRARISPAVNAPLPHEIAAFND
ncbi:hypothetical protein [Pantoea agglomerans]|uniref:hypothetical protein n=1 Tax=Enterobacter agglomerans TaxID=549 RepID=UPI003DA054FD